MRSFCVYRCFDADGALLYIGHSARILGRLEEHAIDKTWFSRIAQVTVEHFPSRAEASAAEAVAIEAEAPSMNVIAGVMRTKDTYVDTETRRAIGQRIREARTRAGMSQAQLAQCLRIRQSAVSQWERGSTLPARMQRAHLRRLLDLTFPEVTAA